jgi:probable HAF family extracellular repeat protein
VCLGALVVTGLLIAVAQPPTVPRVPDRYREVALGFTGDVRSVNDKGHIVGTRVFSGAVRHPFLWRNGSLTDLGQLEPTWDGSGMATDINNRGEIVGVSTTGFKPPLAYDRAFIWRDGAMSPLTAPETDSTANAINDGGMIVGNFTVAGVSHAFLWENGVLIDLGAGYATDINDRGQIAGGNDSGPWIWHHGRFTHLPTGPAQSARILAINNMGWAVGTGHIERENDLPEQRAYLWRHGRIVDLGKIGVGATYPVDINAWGQILGVTNRNDIDEPIPFLWQDGTMIDLSTHGVPRTHTIKRIDDRGRLVGYPAGQYLGQVVTYR